MPLTLQTAKEKLSKIIELGISTTDSRATDRINEAQRRLHSQGIYLGTLQSYAVKVDPLTNIFTKPSGLESIARVSRFSGTAFSSAETVRFLSKGADVFVSDPTTLLPISYVSGSSNSFKLLDRSLSVSVVELVGKATLIEAATPSSELLIEDLDALKLMLLALYREENNQLEQAKAFNDLAIKYLKDKTDASVNVAQKLQHQSSSESTPYGTLGYVRSRLIREMPDLSRINDSELTTLINSSQEAAVAYYNFLSRQDPDAASKLEFKEVFLDSSSLSVTSFEVNRLLVMSLQNKKVEESAVLKKSAFEIIERDFNEQIMSRRKNTYNGELLSSPSGSLSHVCARLALDNPDLLSRPIQHLRRAVAQAEELIINSGRWNGTIDLLEYEILGGEGEYPLPEFVDAVLLANISNRPVSVYDRDYDFHENGPGWNQPGSGSSPLTLAIDRGYTNSKQELSNPNATITLTTDVNAQSQSLLRFDLLSPLESVLSNAYAGKTFKTLINQAIDLPLGRGIPNGATSFKISGPATLTVDSRSGRLTGRITSELVTSLSNSEATLTWPLNSTFKDYTVVVKDTSVNPNVELARVTQTLNELRLNGIGINKRIEFSVFGNAFDPKLPQVLVYSGSWVQNISSPNIISNFHISFSASTPASRRIKVYLRSVEPGNVVRFVYKLKPKVYLNPRDSMIVDHFPAVREVTLGLLSGDQEQLSSRMILAQTLLNQQLKEKRGGRIVRPSIQLTDWAIGAIDSSL